MVLEQFGSTRSAGLVWGWLIMSPRPQSLDDLASGLSLSKASISLYTRLLEQMGVIERVTVLGDRKTYYQASDRAWDLVVDFGIRKFETLIALSQEGAHLAADQKIKNRLTEMQESLRFILANYKLLVEKLHNRNKKPDNE